jgi:hypothetical protein
MKRQLLAVSARYDRRGGRVMIALNNGAVVGFPLASLPGLESATPDELRHIVVEGEGYGLHIACLDADISVAQLLDYQTNIRTESEIASLHEKVDLLLAMAGDGSRG